MSIEIKVPQLPESVSSATVATWHVKVGDSVSRDQNLLDLETDKVMLEVPATESGTLSEIRVKDGDTVQAGDVLAVLTPGEAKAAAGDDKPAPAAKAETAAPAATTASAEGQSPAVRRMGPKPIKVKKPVMSSVSSGVSMKSTVPLRCLCRNFSKVARIHEITRIGRMEPW